MHAVVTEFGSSSSDAGPPQGGNSAGAVAALPERAAPVLSREESRLRNKRVVWTDVADAFLIVSRPGMSWESLGTIFGCSSRVVRDRARILGIRRARHTKRSTWRPAPSPPPEVNEREPEDLFGYRAGHPVTWGLLLSLTPSIAGAKYPYA